MKRIFLVLAIVSITLTSCVTDSYVTTQDDIYVETTTDIVHSSIDFNIIVSRGTPYYYNGSLLYYLYNGLYYYPFYYNNYWYIRVYKRPFKHLYYRPYFRPHKYDYRFNRGYRPQHNWYRSYSSRHHIDYRHQNNARSNNISRPSTPARSNFSDRPMRGSAQPRITPQRGTNDSRLNSSHRNFRGSRGGITRGTRR